MIERASLPAGAILQPKDFRAALNGKSTLMVTAL
jgi:hypothetical protein